jgi:hypothetical protein
VRPNWACLTTDQAPGPSHSSRLTPSKVASYFASGAREVWVCDLHGTMAFYAEGRRVERSRLCSEFPGGIFELQGLDATQMGALAYPDFAPAVEK